METDNGPITIIDYLDDPDWNKKSEPIEPLPEGFGYQLNTIEKARRWLTHPSNWHKTNLFILKWNGLLPTVNEEHAQRLIREPWDEGLPWCVVHEQQKRRAKKAAGDELDVPERSDPDE